MIQWFTIVENNWVRLFKTNDNNSKRFVKISNVNISNKPIFLVEKMCSGKASLIFSTKSGKTLNELTSK